MRVVPERLPAQPVLPAQTFVQICSPERGQDADHRNRDSGLTDEGDLSIEDVVRILVEADDETARDLDAVRLDVADGLQQVELGVDGLVGAEEALDGRGLDPEEDEAEAGIAHRPHQLIIGAEVDRGLGEELERKAVVALPALEHRQRTLRQPAVADEIVVDEEDRPTPPCGKKGVQLCGHAVR